MEAWGDGDVGKGGFLEHDGDRKDMREVGGEEN